MVVSAAGSRISAPIPRVALWQAVLLGFFGPFLKGAGMGELWPHAIALITIGAPMFLAAWLIFRRQR